MNTTDVQDTLREMWETRPARPRVDRHIAGVASGIARRYDIDPVLVRVGFVVAAFSGIGAALYIAGWILLPEEPADPAAPVATSSPRVLVLIALAIAAIVSMATVFSGSTDAILPLLAVAGLLYLLHRSRGGRGVSAAASPVEPAAAAPPAWDPLGAAPFAWDLPEPAPPPAPVVPRRRKLPVTSVTLGLTLLAGGITAAVLLLMGQFLPANLPLILGAMLAMLGTGLVFGAFVRAGRGLIPFALLLGTVTWFAVAAPLDRWEDGWSDLRVAPTSAAELLPSYERGGGEITLDLRNLDLTQPDGTQLPPVETAVSLGAGEMFIRLPENADVSFSAEAGVGNVEFGDRSDSGPLSSIDVTEDLGADGVRSGRLLVLDLETGVGNVEVRRG